MRTRLLEAEDARAYQPLRLRSLEEHPEAFGLKVILTRHQHSALLNQQMQWVGGTDKNVLF